MAFDPQLADLDQLHQDFLALQGTVTSTEETVNLTLNQVTSAIALWLPIVVNAEALADSLDDGNGEVITPPPDPTVTGYVIEGDSIDAGGGTNSQSWPSQFATLTGFSVRNVATQGDTINSMINGFDNPGGIGAAYSSDYDKVIIGGLTNDIALDNTPLWRLKELLYGICHKAQAKGFKKIYLMTVPPRVVGTSIWNQEKEDRRIALNASMLTEFTSYGADGVIDRTAGFTTADLFDGVHPTNAGAFKIAQAVKAALTQTQQPGTITPKGVVFEGDSITAGTSGNTDPYPAQWSRLTGISSSNIAYPGDQIRSLLNNFDSQAGPKFNAQTCDIYMFNGGSNDISDNSADKNSIVDVIQLIIDKAHTAGFKVILSTILPRGFNAANEAIRTSVNQWIRTNWRNVAEGLVDFAAAITDTSGMPDGVHPSNATAAIMAAEVAKTLVASVTAGDVVNSDGSLNEANFLAIANNYWQAFDYRFGAAPTKPTGVPTYTEPVSRYMPDGSLTPPTGGDIRSYQFGNYRAGYTDFSSNEEHFIWAPDNQVKFTGVTGIQGSSTSHDCHSFKPESNWVRYLRGENQLKGVEVEYWRNHGQPNLSRPTCMGRAHGRPGWAVQSLVGFQDGFICTIGANTMYNVASTRLPAGMIPTDIAITSSNEFAIVTYWSTVDKRGGIAVLALCGLGQNMTLDSPTPNPANTNDGWWGEWEHVRWGLHNLGNFAGIKYLGKYEIPGMLAPTAASATTGYYRRGYLNANEPEGTCGNTGDWLQNEAHRQMWITGRFAGRWAKQGAVVVISKSEKKAAIINLEPLFEQITKMYFTTRERFLETTTYGYADNQYPYGFETVPAQKPQFVKMFNLESKPTACHMYSYGIINDPKRWCYVAMENGYMHTISMGGYSSFPGPNDPPDDPSQVQIIGRTFVGANPVSINQVKEKAGNKYGLLRDERDTLLVASRAECAVRWIDFNTANGTEILKLQDSRITDITHAEDMDNHGTESYTVGISDMSGGCIRHYAWGDTYLHTEGGLHYPLVNGEDFNYGGAFSVPGKPFKNDSANVS
jgi:lysophospholipase L1-like esterase